MYSCICSCRRVAIAYIPEIEFYDAKQLYPEMIKNILKCLILNRIINLFTTSEVTKTMASACDSGLPGG